MATMSFGYHYDIGVRVGYDISFRGVILHNVSSKDKSRIIKEIKESGNLRKDIEVVKVEN
jgi:hypothetical protein